MECEVEEVHAGNPRGRCEALSERAILLCEDTGE